MIKKAIRELFRLSGYDIVRYKPHGDQISVRTKRLTYHQTKTGNYYLPTDARADVVANAIINDNVFESEVVEVARKYIKENSIVLDVGANFGQMSILFSEMVGDKGLIYSFDADDFVFDILKRNITANNKDGIIRPIFGAVSNRAGEVMYFPEQDFERFGSYGSYGIDFSSAVGRQVKTITIDSLEIEARVSFMKVDIQGGDLLAMRGAVQTITRNQMPILFEYEYQFEEQFRMRFQEYVDFVLSINYRFERVIGGHNYLILPNKQ